MLCGYCFGRRGMTLIEVLTGTALLGMVAVGIYGVLSQGLRVELYLRTAAVSDQEGFLALEMMARDIQRMVPCGISDQGAFGFFGHSQGFSLVIADDSRLQYVEYECVEADGDRGILMRKIRAVCCAGHDSSQWDTSILARGMTHDGLTVSYLRGDQDGEWKDQWDEDSWPAAVRISLTFLERDFRPRRIVRDVVVPPAGI